MSDRFQRFRETYQTFRYTGLHVEPSPGGLRVVFDFAIDGAVRFQPSLRFPEPAGGWRIDPTGPLARRLLFYVGMVEAVSYWKTYCPPHFEVTAHALCDEEVAWWKKLYYLGLGEFFHRNGIETNAEDFVSIGAAEEARPQPVSLTRAEGKIIPVGGGKDSIVSLELLRPFQAESNVLLLNAPKAARACAEIAGYPPEKIIEVRRTLDPRLLELNAQGALNGHTPFSALLAFVSLFVAVSSGASSILLSNESSANEPTVLGSHVNHQYSKSFEFEKDFRNYVASFVTPDVAYLSLLRPINELQIASLMSGYPAYFSTFRSCNVGSKDGRWCGYCPKCLFTYVMLQPFCSVETLVGIYGHDLLDDASLEPILQELIGRAATKPFECVGTVEEVRAALSLAVAEQPAGAAPRRLLEFVRSQHADVLVSRESARAVLAEWNAQHHLPPALEKRLHVALFQS